MSAAQTHPACAANPAPPTDAPAVPCTGPGMNAIATQEELCTGAAQAGSDGAESQPVAQTTAINGECPTCGTEVGKAYTPTSDDSEEVDLRHHFELESPCGPEREETDAELASVLVKLHDLEALEELEKLCLEEAGFEPEQESFRAEKGSSDGGEGCGSVGELEQRDGDCGCADNFDASVADHSVQGASGGEDEDADELEHTDCSDCDGGDDDYDDDTADCGNNDSDDLDGSEGDYGDDCGDDCGDDYGDDYGDDDFDDDYGDDDDCDYDDDY